MVGVTILHGCDGGCVSRIDLARKSTNITGIITVGPLKTASENERNNAERQVYQAIDGSTETGTAFRVRNSQYIHRTTRVDVLHT